MFGTGAREQESLTESGNWEWFAVLCCEAPRHSWCVLANLRICGNCIEMVMKFLLYDCRCLWIIIIKLISVTVQIWDFYLLGLLFMGALLKSFKLKSRKQKPCNNQNVLNHRAGLTTCVGVLNIGFSYTGDKSQCSRCCALGHVVK